MATRRSYNNGYIQFGVGPVAFISGEMALKQKIKAKLLLFRGEFAWLADYISTPEGYEYYTNYGLPWLTTALNQGIIGGSFNDARSGVRLLLDTSIKKALLETPEVLELLLLEYQYNRNSRSLTLNFTISTVYSESKSYTLTLN